jgi:hypothetical protein
MRKHSLKGTNMKPLCLAVLAFWFAGIACAEEGGGQESLLPDLKTPDDLQAFLERGVICEDRWSADNVFRADRDHILAALKKLDAAVRKIGFTTKLSTDQPKGNSGNYSLRISPGKIKIYGFDVENITISVYDSIGFDAMLKVDKKAVLDKLNTLGLDRYPFEHPIGDAWESYFDNKKIADHIGFIMVGDNCEQAKSWDEGNQLCLAEKAPTPHGSICWAYRKHGQENRAKNKACQAGNISVSLSCVWHDL